MPRYDLDGKVAIVTGAARGIGEAVASRLARAGAAVIVSGVDGPAAAQIAQSIEQSGGRARSLMADMTNADDVAQLVGGAVEAFGRLDILVNNAGIAAVGLLLETDEQTWDTIMRVNAKGTLLCS